MSNYAGKTNLKGTTGIDLPNLELKSNLDKLKAEVDKVDPDKLKTVLPGLNKLSNVVDNEVLKKAVYDKLGTKVNNIYTSRFVLKLRQDIIQINQV